MAMAWASGRGSEAEAIVLNVMFWKMFCKMLITASAFNLVDAFASMKCRRAETDTGPPYYSTLGTSVPVSFVAAAMTTLLKVYSTEL